MTGRANAAELRALATLADETAQDYRRLARDLEALEDGTEDLAQSRRELVLETVRANKRRLERMAVALEPRAAALRLAANVVEDDERRGIGPVDQLQDLVAASFALVDRITEHGGSRVAAAEELGFGRAFAELLEHSEIGSVAGAGRAVYVAAQALDPLDEWMVPDELSGPAPPPKGRGAVGAVMGGRAIGIGEGALGKAVAAGSVPFWEDEPAYETDEERTR